MSNYKEYELNGELIDVNIDSPEGQAWLKGEGKNAKPTSTEDTQEGKQNGDATTDASATPTTPASNLETNQSQNNQQENTGLPSETGFSEPQELEDALVRGEKANRQNPSLAKIQELNKKRNKEGKSELNISDYKFEEGSWTIPGDDGKPVVLDEADPEHGEAVSILNQQRDADVKWANENVPPVTRKLTSVDDSESLDLFKQEYAQYGFEFEESDSWFSDEITVTSTATGESQTFPVDALFAGSSKRKGEADDVTANAMTEWMKSRAIRTNQTSAEAERDQTIITNRQISENRVKVKDQMSAVKTVENITEEDDAEEEAIRNRFRSEAIRLAQSQSRDGMVTGLDKILNDMVKAEYKKMGKPMPSDLRNNVNNESKKSIDFAKMITAKREYGKQLGLSEEDMDNFMNSDIKVQDLEVYEGTNEAGEEVNLQTIYEGLDSNNPDVDRISRSVLQSEYDTSTTLKNISTQVNALDGAWGNWFFQTDRQGVLKEENKNKLDNISNEHKVAMADVTLIEEALIDKTTKQSELMGKIDVEGTKAKIQEIKSKQRSTKEIDSLDAQIKKISQGKYTTQNQVDDANAKIKELTTRRQGLASEYNSSIKTDQAEINKLINEQQGYIDEFNANIKSNERLIKGRNNAYNRLNNLALEEDQIEQYINVLDKNHQLGTVGLNNLMNSGIDLLQGLKTFTYMPFEITDEMILDGELTDPFLKGGLNVLKLLTGQPENIDWDGDPYTPTDREDMKEAINDWQEKSRASVRSSVAFNDIKSASDAAEWAYVMGMGQLPQLGLMAATGGTSGLAFLGKSTGVALLGAGAAGQKYESMQDSKKLYQETAGIAGVDHDIWTMLGVSYLSGGAEALSETVMAGQLKYVKGALGTGIIREAREATLEGASRYFRNNVFSKDVLLRTAKDMFEEGGSELLAGMAGNTLDYFSGEKKEFNLFEGGLEQFVSGALISSMIKTPVLFKHAIAPFQSVTNKQAIYSNSNRLQNILQKIHNPKFRDKLPEEELKDLEAEAADIIATNKQLIAEDVERVDSLSDKEKGQLVNINSKVNKLQTQYNELFKPKKDKTGKDAEVNKKERQYQADKLNEQYQKLQEQKNEILKKHPRDKVKRDHQNAMLLADKMNGEIEAAGGELNVQTRMLTNEEIAALEIDDTMGEGVSEELKALGVDLNLLTGNAKKYGAMVPRFDGDKLVGLDIIVNKDTALQDGFGNTGVHELAHAALYNTIKQDPRTRKVLGGKLASLIDNKNIKFKNKEAEDLYNARINQYDTHEQGEEALVIVSEMLADGDIEFNDSILQKFKDFFRQFVQQYGGFDIKLDTKDDVRNFLKDFHTSVKNNQPNPAIVRMMTKGAKGALVNENVYKDSKAKAQFSKAVDLSLKADPDLRVRFDKFTKDDDGNGVPKYANQEDFELSEDFYNAYLEIVESNGLDGLIRAGLAGTIKPEDMSTFVANVKKRIGERFLPKRIEDKNGNPILDVNGREQFRPGYKISNESLFGWLTGVAGGQGKSIIFRARGDEMVAYNKRKKIDDQARSLDAPKGESGRTIGDDILADRDAELERLDEEDLTPRRKELVKEVVTELKAREVLGFEASTNDAIDNAITDAGVPLDGLNYKDVKAFVNSAEKITRKDKDGNTITDKKTGKPKLFKPTKTGDVKPNGPLFKVLEAVSKEFGVDPLRILADQDLNGAQRKAAQKLIYKLSVNPDGAFNNQLFELLPEGDTQSVTATGVANTKLGDFYTAGGRGVSAKGATTAGKPTQTKRTDVSMDEFLGKFGIKPDGAFEGGTKNDGAIRALIVQMAQIEANQSMRKDAFENGTSTEAARAKLAEGKGKAVWSVGIPDAQANDVIDAISKDDLSQESIERIVEVMYPDLPNKHKAIVRSLMKEVDGIMEIDEALNGELRNITGKNLQDALIEKFEEVQYKQGIKAMLKAVLPLKENGSPVDPGSRALDLEGIKKQRSHLVNQTSEIIEIYGPKRGLEIVIGQLAPAYSNAAQIGDKRYTVDKPGGKVIDNPNYSEFKLNEDGTFKLNKDGKKVRETNRLQVTTGQPDFIALISQAGYEVVKIDKKVDKDMKGFTYKAKIDGVWVPLKTTMFAENTESFLKDKDFEGRKTQAEEARVLSKLMLDNAWARYKSNDSFDAADFGLLAMSLGSSMESPLRRSANAEFIQDGIEGVIARGKAKGLPMKKIVRYEHMKSKEAVISEIIGSYMNKGELDPKVWDGYQVQVISEAHDKLIDAAGYKTKSPKDGSPRAYNEKTLAAAVRIYDDIKQDLGLIRSIDPSKKGKSNEVIGENWMEALKLLKKPGNGQLLGQLGGRIKRISWSKSAPVKGMSTFDFDETLIIGGDNFVVATHPETGKEVKIKSDQWPIQGPALAADGYEFDFSDFANVRGGTEGPLLQKMKNQVAKYGPENVFVLTARQQDSAIPIHEWLKSQGINIPLKNITGLGKSEGSAKAQWMLDKFAEGYNDMYFVDDALSNVKAVKEVLDQLDIKSKVVQAKIQFSKSGGPAFNEMLERKSGVPKDKVFSDAQARLRGSKAGGFKFFVPPSAEDFKGLLYNFLGRGKQGDADMQFFKEHLLDPFAKGIRDLNNTKQKIADEFKAVKQSSPDVVKRLNKVLPNSDYTLGDAIRVYLWNKNAIEIPGLSPQEIVKLSEVVANDPDATAFALKLEAISRSKDGYVKPDENWVVGSIASDLYRQTNDINRADFLSEWKDNVDVIFSPENMNKIEAVYGTDFRDALENMLGRMETGSNRVAGKDKVVNGFMDWINGSVGAVMFFNTRSAALQTLSTVNFIDWNDNNIFKAAKAFANQKQYWADFLTLWNSDMLKQRRAGMAIDVNLAELSNVVSKASGKDKAKAVVRYLLQIGFTPTQIADSFAIAAGGSTFYRNKINKYLKEGMSQKEAEAKAFDEFQEIAEETQQSSRPDLISQQQAGTLGRLILAWQNTPMQYTRLTKKAISDLVNGRGDWRSHVSRILYYGAMQNVIFGSLQTGLAFLMFGGEEDEEKTKIKATRVANGALDTILRGTGVYGAMVSTLKNTIMKYMDERDKPYGRRELSKVALEAVQLSPPIGSKLRKIMSAIYSYEYNKGVPEKMGLSIDNPMLNVVGNIVEATTNIPLARAVRKAQNLEEAVNGNHETWKRVALVGGWDKWSLDVTDGEIEKAREEVKIEKKEKKKAEKKAEKEQKKKEEEQKKKDEGIKQVRCSGIKSNGQRCSIMVDTKAKSAKCMYHKTYKEGEASDRDNDGIKEYRCKAITGSGKRCKNRTENTNKKCYAHQ